MIDFKNRYVLFLSFLIGLTLASCKKDAWNEHTKMVSQDLERNLFQQISSNPELSKFTEYLIETKYDSVLNTSNSLTVWAPTNAALQNLSQDVVADPDKLKQFIGNHIANQSYFTDMADADGLIIKGLNKKNVVFGEDNFEGANIIKGNTYVANGVLHIIDNFALPKPNALEFMLTKEEADIQKDFIQSLYHIEMDTSKGVKLYTDPVTKQTVFQEGTTFPVTKNYFFQGVSDISSEDSLFTFIILTDEAFNAEREKLSPYFATSSLDADRITNWNVVKDLVVNGLITQDKLGQTLTSVNGVQLSINPSDVVETKRLSNGIAYVVNKVEYPMLKNKIPTIIIEGEFTDSLRTPRTPTYKINRAADGSRFTDIQVSSITSSPDPLYYFRYKTIVNSVKYKVYWRAINNIYTSPVSMKIDFNTLPYYPKTSEPELVGVGYHDVPYLDDPANPEFYKEVYLGEFTSNQYGELYAFLASALGATSGAPTALTLDYIKLEPVN